ncbi:MAG: hypothetical protein Fur0014_20190 [Rubrivivax sp.]
MQAPTAGTAPAPTAKEDSDVNVPASPLYPHQVAGVQFLARRGRAILADDMGLGKTRQAIVAMNLNPAVASTRRADSRALAGTWAVLAHSPDG